MKNLKQSLLIAFVLLMFAIHPSLHAQVIFFENFQNGMPSNFTLINADGLTPAPAVSYVNNAWIVREDFIFNSADSVALSTSWYSPEGQADDWMITPAITLTNDNVLRWQALAPDVDFRDGYEVRISTTTPDTAGCFANPPLFTIAEENTTWTNRSVSLSAYAGQTVYIAFRNNSNNKFLLLIDDILVEAGLQHDAELTSVMHPSEYTMIPHHQSPTLEFEGVINNRGSNALTDVTLNVNVFNSALANVYSASSAPTASLAPGGSVTKTIASWIPLAPDTYVFEYFASANETDLDNSNDTLHRTILITDSVFARDNNMATGTLGIGGGGGILGQTYTLNNAALLSSVSFFMSNNNQIMTNQPVSAVIYDFTNEPNAIIASTDTIIKDTTTNVFVNLPIYGGPLMLQPGTYYIGVAERDSNITMGTTPDIFTPGTTWVNFPGSNGWKNNEFFMLNLTFVLRGNFQSACQTFEADISGFDVLCYGDNNGVAVANPNNGQSPFTYSWSNGATMQTISNLPAGTYSVIVTDANGCEVISYVVISEPAALSASLDSTAETCSNCNDAGVSVTPSGGTSPYQYSWSNGSTASSQANVAPGVYMVTVTDANGCTFTGSVTAPLFTSIFESISKNISVHVYPNPNSGRFMLDISLTSADVLKIEIFDVMGRMIFTEKTEKISSYSGELHLQNSSSQIYFVKAQTGDAVRVMRVVVE